MFNASEKRGKKTHTISYCELKHFEGHSMMIDLMEL
jgi:hypothetical protein